MSGAAVKMAEDKGCQLSDLTVADLATINPLFTDDVVEVRAFLSLSLSPADGEVEGAAASLPCSACCVFGLPRARKYP